MMKTPAEIFVQEMHKASLKMNTPSLMGAFVDPDTEEPIYPELADRNSRLISQYQRLNFGKLD